MRRGPRTPLLPSSVPSVFSASRLRARGLLTSVVLWLSLPMLACSSSDHAGSGGGGGSRASGGGTSSGGHSGSGGSLSTGGSSAGLGGNAGGTHVGGASGSGATTASGGTPAGTGGASGGGDSGSGGVRIGSGTGGSTDRAGNSGSGGASGLGGSSSAGAGGTTGTGAIGGTTGTPNSVRPCDIYQTANTPCVAAHSMVRALYGAYNGSLYQVRRASDNALQDIKVASAGGYVDTSVQDNFCKGATCTVSIIYDQSPQGNDLKKSGVAHWLPNGGSESSATAGKATVAGHTVYGIYVTNINIAGNDIKYVAYRNNTTKGVAKENQAEAMYMVVDGKRYSDLCCFDYGNASTTGNDEGNATMEAIYFGSDTGWGGYGQGKGPWIAADLENGMFKGDDGYYLYSDTHKTPWPTAKSIVANYVTAMLKGPDTDRFTLKGGDAQSGTLTTMWDSNRPKKSPAYSPKHLQGAIILGTGGDGSNTGTGTFFEGAMTLGNPPDSVDDLIQANIVAAGYGN